MMLRNAKSVCLLLTALAVVAVASATPASGSVGGPVVYVDPSGGCAGLSPCYTTIDQAVRQAGPAPATVNVFPGTYNESVNLGLLGIGTAGGGPGDVILRTVSATGEPLIATAMIEAASGPGIFTGSNFAGAVTIIGFLVTSQNDDGIRIDSTGDVRIEDVFASLSGLSGVRVDDGDTVQITRVTANGNGAEGVRVAAREDIFVTDSNANDNDSTPDTDGFNLDAGGDLVITDVSANRNGDQGIDVDGANGAVTVDGCSVDSNGSEGLDVDGTQGTVSVSGCTATNNGDDGIDIGNDETDTEVMTGAAVTDSTLTDNLDDGLDLALQGPGSVHCVNFSGNDAGLDNDSIGQSINAEGNWWGSASGPAHPSNPSGTGDSVKDSATDSSGTVDFMPFLSAPCEPALELTWLDVNCNDLVDPLDALEIALHIVVLPRLIDGADCPALDATLDIEGFSPQMLGDPNCDGSITGLDIVYALRVVAELDTPTPPSGCPAPRQEVVATPA